MRYGKKPQKNQRNLYCKIRLRDALELAMIFKKVLFMVVSACWRILGMEFSRNSFSAYQGGMKNTSRNKMK